MAKTIRNSKKDNGNAQPASIKSTRWFNWNYSIIVFILPLILYVFCVKNDYNLDDNLVTQNHKLTSQGISGIPEIFKSHYYSDEMGYAYEYRPLVLSSFAIEHQFFGDNPFVSHFINVLLYAFLCFILYRCLRRFFKNTNYLFSFLITMVFAFHPTHTEVVCSIKNRDDILAMIFGLFALRYAMLFADKKSYWNLILMSVSFVLSLFSKKSGLIFGAAVPFLVLIYSGEILAATIIGVALYLSGALINPGMMPHDWRLVFLAIPLSFLLYSFFGLKSENGKFLLLKAFDNLKKVLTVEEDEAGGEINATVEKTNNPNNVNLWAFTFINLAVFGVLFFYNIMLLTGPALVAVGLFIVAGNRNLQIANLMAFVLIIGLVTHRFFDPFIYLLAATIMGMLYYYNIHNLRKAILLFAVLILFSAFPKIGKVGPGVVVLAIFILYTHYNAKWIGWLSVIAVIIISRKVFFAKHSFGMINTINGVNKVRFFFFGLLIVFLSIPRKTKLLYAPLIIMAFSLMLLLGIGEAQVSKKEGKTTISVVNGTQLEPRNSSRPLTYSEAPVTQLSPLRIRIGTSALISLKYLEKVLIPWPLSFYYGYKYIEPTDIFTVWPLLGIAAYVCLMVLGFAMLKKSKSLFAGILLYIIGIAAVSDFFYPMPGMMADRFLFIPSLGFAIILVAGVSLLLKINWADFTFKPGKLPRVMKGVLLIIFISYGYLTIARIPDWKDKLTLFRHDIKNVDESCQAHNLLAVNLVVRTFEMQNTDSQTQLRNEAIIHFKKAIAIYPGFMNTAYDAGRTYSLLNLPDSALVYYKMANALVDTFPAANNDIGKILMFKGQYAEAAPYFERGIKYGPYDKYPYEQAGLAYFSLKRYQESLRVTKLEISRFPGDIGSYVNAGRIFENMGNIDSALVYYQRAYSLSNGNVQLKMMIDGLEKKR